jgi:hypothetical protein
MVTSPKLFLGLFKIHSNIILFLQELKDGRPICPYQRGKKYQNHISALSLTCNFLKHHDKAR